MAVYYPHNLANEYDTLRLQVTEYMMSANFQVEFKSLNIQEIFQQASAIAGLPPSLFEDGGSCSNGHTPVILGDRIASPSVIV